MGARAMRCLCKGTGTDHTTSSEVRALLVLFAIPQQAVKGPDAIGDEVVWLK